MLDVAVGRKDSTKTVRVINNALEPLESRLLLAFSAHVNFQPAGSGTPSGYVWDIGRPYGARNGLTYGWNYTNSNARERNAIADQRYDTLAQMQYRGVNYKWEIAVPSGTYKVHLVAGDPSYTNSMYKITAEGKLIAFAIPTSTKKFVEATTNVTVTDGRLTIGNAPDAINNKISYIDVTSATTTSTPTTNTTLLTPPAGPTWLSASAVSTSQIRLNWNDASTRESGYYVERSSSSSGTYTRIATLGAGSTTYVDSWRAAGTTYYYRVAAYNSHGKSTYAKDSAATKSATTSTPPAGPNGLSTSGASTTQIRLNWRDNSTRESGFYVERSTDNGTTYFRIATLGANSHTYLDGGRTAGKMYYYRVAAYNSAGKSTYAYASGKTLSSTTSSAPAGPSNLGAGGISTTQIRLNWRDNSTRESGFYVERSTDNGSTYSRIGTLGSNSVTFLDGGRTAGKTYYYRVAAYGSAGTSPFAVASGRTSSSTSTPPPWTSNSAYYDGVAIGAGGDPSRAIPILRSLNIKAVRLWDGLSAWSNRWYKDPVFAKAIQYHNAGFKVTLLTTTTRAPTYSQAKTYFDWVQTVPGLKGAVDFWEIGNEPDLTKYYGGTLEHYVANELRGAWDSLHPNGEKVVGGAPIFPSTAQRAKDAGYLNYVDIANVHPYNSTVSGLRSDMAKFKAVFNTKPLVATEWNFHYVTDKTQWASQVREMHQYLDDYFMSAYYFGFEVNGTGSGAGGLVYDGSYARNTMFYNAVDSWYSSTSSAAAAPATTSSATSSSSSATNSVDSLFSNTNIL
jgi:hypothetical protein